jgi:SAM-dependent methyltransferase
VSRPEQPGGAEPEGWNLRYQGDDPVFTVDPSTFLGPEIGGLAPGRALDLGSGEGRNALWLAERGWRMTAVDFSDVGVAKARRLAEGRRVEVDWVVADLRSYDPPEGTFDLVLQSFVHLPADDRRAILARASAALRPGGTILIVGYDVSHLDHGAPGGPSDPDLLLTVDGVVADLVGVEIERAERRQLLVEDDGGTTERYAVDVVVRGRRRDGLARRRPDPS